MDLKLWADLTSSASFIVFPFEKHLKRCVPRKPRFPTMSPIPFNLTEDLTAEASRPSAFSLQRQFKRQLWAHGVSRVSPPQSEGDQTALGGQL